MGGETSTMFTAATAARYHRRFSSAVARLQHACIPVTDNVEAGAAEYVWLRSGWDAPVVRLADFLGYTPHQIDVSTERIVHARSTP